MSGFGLATFLQRDVDEIEGHTTFIDRVIQNAEQYDRGLVNEMALGLGGQWQQTMRETAELVAALEALAQAAQAAERRREETTGRKTRVHVDRYGERAYADRSPQ